jgi:hypothetical protein
VRGLLLAGLWSAAACEVPLAPCEAETTLLGSWQYTGVQDAPAPAELVGTLDINSESCEGFQGRLDVVELDGFGGTRRLAGPVTGRVLDGSGLRFDAFLSAVPRQHVATLGAAGVVGTWVIVASAGEAPLAGSFSAQRENVP